MRVLLSFLNLIKNWVNLYLKAYYYQHKLFEFYLIHLLKFKLWSYHLYSEFIGFTDFIDLKCECNYSINIIIQLMVEKIKY